MTVSYRSARQPIVHPASAGDHRFALGQRVRLSGGFTGLNTRAGEVYQITAKLPPSGGEPQYRIRTENEVYERVTTEARLEAANTAEATLLSQTFHG